MYNTCRQLIHRNYFRRYGYRHSILFRKERENQLDVFDQRNSHENMTYIYVLYYYITISI